MAIHPGDGEEVGHLPGEKDAKEHPRAEVERRLRGGPADDRRDGAGDRADDGAERGAALQRGVESDVDDDGRGGEAGSEGVRGEPEPGDADDAERDAEREGDGRFHAAGGERAVAGALHEAIDLGFDALIEHGGGRCGEGGAEDRVDELQPVERAGGGHAEADEGGDDDEQAEARFGQRHQVGEQARLGEVGRGSERGGGFGFHARTSPAPAVKRLARKASSRLSASTAAPFTTWKVVSVIGFK